MRSHPVRSPELRFFLHPLAWAATAALFAGCATPTAGPSAAAPAGAASTAVAAAPAASSAVPGAVPPRPPEAGAPKPFAEVIKDAVRQDGLIPVWRKDEKVWLEIAPERLAKPMLLSINIAQSVGERGLYASQMGPRWMVEFRRIGNQMQLVADQVRYRGERDPAAARAVGEGFSESLIGSSPVASAAHPDRKSVLVDASFLLGDLAGYSTELEYAFRLPFAPDKANSYFETVRAEPNMTTLSAKVHYSIARLPAPPLAPPGAPPSLLPPPPRTLPDGRSLFVGYVYNLRELAATPMTPRQADPRVGYFTESYTDLSDDLRANPRVHNIKRWRLEKKDPAAPMSEPVKPITYWLDRNIPQRYRASIEAGILEWNKAFERIGYRNAIVVRQQADDATFNDMDGNHASIRWFVGADVGFAIGPSHADPRTGEIMDADIGMSDVFGRGSRRQVRDDIGAPAAHEGVRSGLRQVARGAFGDDNCTYAADGAQELDFALDLMEARGELEPDSPEAEAFVQNYIRDVITHEVGHTLGLRHNFKASTTVTRQQLRDKDFATTRGISGSVMDYNAFNLSLDGEPKGEPNMVTLGAYDYYAIEYGYKDVDPGKAAAELGAIVARSGNDATLAFADDPDADGELDPLVNRFDLGDDPLAYAQRRLALSKELWGARAAASAAGGRRPRTRPPQRAGGLPPGGHAAADRGQVRGGMYTSRDQPGSGKPNFRPVDSATQRQALKFLTDGLFSNDSFRFKPEFLAGLTPDYIEGNRGRPAVGAAGRAADPDADAGPPARRRHRAPAAGTAQLHAGKPAQDPDHAERGLHHAAGRRVERAEDGQGHRADAPQPAARAPEAHAGAADAAVAGAAGRRGESGAAAGGGIAVAAARRAGEEGAVDRDARASGRCAGVDHRVAAGNPSTKLTDQSGRRGTGFAGPLASPP